MLPLDLTEEQLSIHQETVMWINMSHSYCLSHEIEEVDLTGDSKPKPSQSQVRLSFTSAEVPQTDAYATERSLQSTAL